MASDGRESCDADEIRPLPHQSVEEESSAKGLMGWEIKKLKDWFRGRIPKWERSHAPSSTIQSGLAESYHNFSILCLVAWSSFYFIYLSHRLCHHFNQQPNLITFLQLCELVGTYEIEWILQNPVISGKVTYICYGNSIKFKQLSKKIF